MYFMKPSIFQNTTEKFDKTSALEGFIDYVHAICFDYSQGDSTHIQSCEKTSIVNWSVCSKIALYFFAHDCT